ncbi:MAG: calcineurin-like phosphoesterase family protein [Verrucomicrobiota bacterium]
MRRYLLFTLPLILSLSGLIGATATGLVFEDLNANQQHDKGEPGLESVLVSNGVEIVATDSEGRYELPVSEDTIIFVIKPTGFQVHIDELNLPRGYYMHKPAGSPKLNYAGVEPTGPLPESVDFPLYRTAESEKFSIILFGDPQPKTAREVGYFLDSAVKELIGVKGFRFGVTLGDIVDDSLELYTPLNAGVAEIGIPWYNVYGNHDMNFDAETDALADETFERVFGPASYAFQSGGVHFINIDNVHFPQTFTKKRYVGGFTDTQIEFVGNYLEHVPENALIVLFVHIPLFNENQFGTTFLAEQREEFFELFENHPNFVSFSGHTHRSEHYFFGEDYGWKHKEPHHHFNVGTTSGSWWGGPFGPDGIPLSTMRDGTPRGYVYVHFDGNQYSTEYKIIGQALENRVQLFHPKVVGKVPWPNARLSATFFGGSEDAKAEFKVGDRGWKNMRYTRGQTEPRYTLERLLADESDSPALYTLPHPDECKNLWQATLPSSMKAGTYPIIVRITDKYGKVFSTKSTYRLAAP